MMTDFGLRASLFAALEFGYKACERNINIQAAIEEATPLIDHCCKVADLPKEICKTTQRKRK